MSDPYAPPGSQRGGGGPQGRRGPGAPGGAGGADPQQERRQLPPSVPHRPAERRPPDPQRAARTARLGLHFSLLVLAGLVALTALPLPWRLGGTVFVLVGAVVGVVALVQAVRARLRWTAVLVLGLGLGMVGLLLLVEAVNLALWPATSQRQACLDSALTAAGRQECDQQYEQAVRDLLPAVPVPPAPSAG
ncbi:hypothetical protein [Quadrisphaera sp. KR29]|uniref:hypothetical protein n=1 Tax=Quadrisphaera sp. KR29 TaxID=3461391 RepID=UPI004044911D